MSFSVCAYFFFYIRYNVKFMSAMNQMHLMFLHIIVHVYAVTVLQYNIEFVSPYHSVVVMLEGKHRKWKKAELT